MELRKGPTAFPLVLLIELWIEADIDVIASDAGGVVDIDVDVDFVGDVGEWNTAEAMRSMRDCLSVGMLLHETREEFRRYWAIGLRLFATVNDRRDCGEQRQCSTKECNEG